MFRFELFNSIDSLTQRRSKFTKPQQLSNLSAIPHDLQSFYKRLLATKPASRITLFQVLDSDFITQNSLVQTSTFLEEISIKNDVEFGYGEWTPLSLCFVACCMLCAVCCGWRWRILAQSGLVRVSVCRRRRDSFYSIWIIISNRIPLQFVNLRSSQHSLTFFNTDLGPIR